MMILFTRRGDQVTVSGDSIGTTILQCGDQVTITFPDGKKLKATWDRDDTPRDREIKEDRNARSAYSDGKRSIRERIKW